MLAHQRTTDRRSVLFHFGWRKVQLKFFVRFLISAIRCHVQLRRRHDSTILHAHHVNIFSKYFEGSAPTAIVCVPYCVTKSSHGVHRYLFPFVVFCCGFGPEDPFWRPSGPANGPLKGLGGSVDKPGGWLKRFLEGEIQGWGREVQGLDEGFRTQGEGFEVVLFASDGRLLMFFFLFVICFLGSVVTIDDRCVSRDLISCNFVFFVCCFLWCPQRCCFVLLWDKTVTTIRQNDVFTNEVARALMPVRKVEKQMREVVLVCEDKFSE